MSTILSLRPWRIEKGKKNTNRERNGYRGHQKRENFVKLKEADDQLSHCSQVELYTTLSF